MFAVTSLTGLNAIGFDNLSAGRRNASDMSARSLPAIADAFLALGDIDHAAFDKSP